MYNGSNCDRKSQLSEILTEQSNPRGLLISCGTGLFQKGLRSLSRDGVMLD